MLQLRWPDNPKVVRHGDSLDLSLVLENRGSERVEFLDSFLELFGRLVDDAGHEVLTEGFRVGRKLPTVHHRLEPGDVETVQVCVFVSPEDQCALPAGSYSVVLPLGDARDTRMNSVLTSAGVAPPPVLTVIVRPAEPH